MTAHDPTDPDHLTGPERAAARAQAKPLLDRVNACGGCFCCTKRNTTTESLQFGLAECGLHPPAQFKKQRCEFTPDFDRLYPGRAEQY